MKPRARKYTDKVSTDELQFFRQDAQREEKLGITSYVVCRECGAQALSLYTYHLNRHRFTPRTYRAKWPVAPLRCTQERKRNADDMQKRRAADPEGERKRSRNWYKANREKAIAAVRRYAAAQPDRVKESRKTTYAKHREEIAQRTREERRAHPQKYRKRGRQSYRKERERAKARARKRYSLLKAALATVTAQAGSSGAARNPGGRPEGMGEDTKAEAKELLRYVNEFIGKFDTKKGAMVYASKKVYGPTVESRKAVARGNKTILRYRKLNNSGQKPAA